MSKNIEERICHLQEEVLDIGDKIRQIDHQMVKEGKKPFFVCKIKDLEHAIKKRNIQIDRFKQQLKRENSPTNRDKQQKLFIELYKQLVTKEIGEEKANEILKLADDLSTKAAI